MNKLKLGFTDTYDNAKKFFYWLLSQHYDVVIDNDNPDYLIFGDRNFGSNNLNYKNCVKIFYTGENQRYWDYDCNFAITFDHINSPKHYRLPLYVLEMYAAEWDNNFPYSTLFTPIEDPEKLWEQRHTKEQLATYIQSNPHCQFRTLFVQHFKNPVLCAGPHLNNTGSIIPRTRNAKIDLMNEYSFNIAFENGSYPGYVTEKLLDAFYAKTVPIYWGSKLVHRDFNPKRFINYMEWNKRGDGHLIHDYLKHVNNTKDEYIAFLQEPVFVNNMTNEFVNIENFMDWFRKFVYKGSSI